MNSEGTKEAREDAQREDGSQAVSAGVSEPLVNIPITGEPPSTPVLDEKLFEELTTDPPQPTSEAQGLAAGSLGRPSTPVAGTDVETIGVELGKLFGPAEERQGTTRSDSGEVADGLEPAALDGSSRGLAFPSSDDSEMGGGAMPMVPTAAAPTVPARPKPKIDFAAIRKARSSNVPQAKAAVNRLFGVEVSDEPPATPIQESDEARPPPEPKPAPAGPQRAPKVWKDRIDDVTQTLSSYGNDVLRFIAFVGILLLVNAVAVLTLAVLGWI